MPPDNHSPIACEMPMLRRTAFAVVICAASLTAAPARADDWDTCKDESVAADVSITACTKLINSRRNKGNDLAIAYYNRGISYRQKGDVDRALSDYNESIRINPSYARAFNNRGNIWKDKGDLDRAIADYDQAIKLEPGFALAYANRGDVFDDKGDQTRAIADLD